MESGQIWLSIGLGAGLGIFYLLASLISSKRALRSRQGFILIVVGMMMIRLLVALVFLVGILVWLPVSDVAFLGSFFVIFVIGLVTEVWMLHKRRMIA